MLGMGAIRRERFDNVENQIAACKFNEGDKNRIV